jgi:hypothetical protein
MGNGDRLQLRPRRRPTARPAGALLVALTFLTAAGCGGRAGSRPAGDSEAAVVVAEAGMPIGPPEAAMPLGPGGEAGIYHPLEAGQTLYRLSILYDVPLDRLLEVNRIVDPTGIPAGSPIFVPGAARRLPYPGAVALLGWPLFGAITNRFAASGGGRGRHDGLDIDGDEGDPIRAAAAGRVVQAGRYGQYGRYVMIDHGDGLQTLYAHASRLLVRRGQEVAAGEMVALVGRTGNARGTHLHFEVLKNGRPVDPLPLLRGDSAARASGR